ncbi:TIGR03085 family metal-binding protein [Williamsia phyllosphaerae]|uniref:TIGR03085 family protein n=1 Tax=Williamsia phyllosphaerae TaxID=885042 RepID=A0ABQ1V6N5_9NOCA|nr:TIGR03085 family metal-binding protein [Williamsia phyllosphaerae]GGF40397.1 TIGR03085 family protein [Williamsia phyllosphaerae]
MTAARAERAALVETLRLSGPDAPTLCEGWATRDITAHMVIREARLDAAPGILLPPLAGYTERVQKGYARRDWTGLVDQLAAGPPWYSPLRPLDRFVNAAEMFVHHEDVRRAVAGWTVRPLDPDLTAALRRPLPLIARKSLGSAPARVELRTPDGATVTTVGSGPTVTVTGEPGELLLFAFGRDEVACEFAGDEDAIAAVKASDRSA